MKNVITTIPGVGDIVCLDAQKKIKFIAYGTYDSSALSEGWILVGVVGLRQGNQLTIINKESTTQKWSEVYKWKVSGWKLDGQPHTTDITFYDSQKPAKNKTFSYTASVVGDIIGPLTAWFEAYKMDSGLQYTCHEEDGNIVVVLETYNSWYQYIFHMSGLTVDYYMGEGLPISGSTYSKNGIGSEYKGMNWEKYYSYVHDATSSTFNPTKPVSSLGTYPLSYASYSNEIGKFARDIYGEGEDGYKKYLSEYMMIFPTHRGVLGMEFRDALTATLRLAGVMVQMKSGESVPHYPAAHYCAGINYDNPVMAAGKWMLPTMYQNYQLYSQIKMDGTDRINSSLKAIGGTRLQFASAWSCCRCSVYGSWVWYGHYGCSDDVNLYGRLWSVPLLLLNLSECEDINC